jgi:hypothetical protein
MIKTLMKVIREVITWGVTTILGINTLSSATPKVPRCPLPLNFVACHLISRRHEPT